MSQIIRKTEATPTTINEQHREISRGRVTAAMIIEGIESAKIAKAPTPTCYASSHPVQTSLLELAFERRILGYMRYARL